MHNDLKALIKIKKKIDVLLVNSLEFKGKDGFETKCYIFDWRLVGITKLFSQKKTHKPVNKILLFLLILKKIKKNCF